MSKRQKSLDDFAAKLKSIEDDLNKLFEMAEDFTNEAEEDSEEQTNWSDIKDFIENAQGEITQASDGFDAL